MSAITDISITVIAEDTAPNRHFVPVHGLCLHLDFDGHQVLLDSAQEHGLAPNAKHLGINPENIEFLVLSHGHYDHTGGIAWLIDNGFSGGVCYHPDALEPSWSRSKNGSSRPIGIPGKDAAALQSGKAVLMPSAGPREIIPGMMTTGYIERTHRNEESSIFFKDRALEQADSIPEDQALFFNTSKGIVVCCGCCHAGLANTLNRVAELSGASSIYALIGGLHLYNAPLQIIKSAIDAINHRNIQVIAPGHCTGALAIEMLHNRFAKRVIPLHCGRKIAIS